MVSVGLSGVVSYQNIEIEIATPKTQCQNLQGGLRPCVEVQHPASTMIHSFFCSFFYLFIYFLDHFYFPASGQAVVSGVVPSPPRYVPSVFIAHRVRHSHCSSTFIEYVANSRFHAFFRESICAQENLAQENLGRLHRAKR